MASDGRLGFRTLNGVLSDNSVRGWRARNRYIKYHDSENNYRDANCGALLSRSHFRKTFNSTGENQAVFFKSKQIVLQNPTDM